VTLSATLPASATLIGQPSLVACAAASLCAIPAFAQNYPTKTVRIIIPFTPGGGADIQGRALAQKLTERFGQQVIIDNRPGASGMIGADAAAKAAPDGYTFLMAYTSEIAIMPGMLKKMGRGLFVTEMLGHGINLLTGDYSRGAAGYWVENGEIAYPVEEITVAGNLKDMFRGVLSVGSDRLVRGAYTCGSILVDNMTIAGN